MSCSGASVGFPGRRDAVKGTSCGRCEEGAPEKGPGTGRRRTSHLWGVPERACDFTSSGGTTSPPTRTRYYYIGSATANEIIGKKNLSTIKSAWVLIPSGEGCVNP